MSGEQYDADYFLRGKQTGKSLYTDYKWMPELTIPMAARMVAHCGIAPEDTILDFGCARGYLVKALRRLGYNAWGYDVSQWALDNSDEQVREYLICNDSALFSQSFDWVIAKDVLEHVDGIAQAIGTLKDISRKGVLAIVPLAHVVRGSPHPQYDVPEYELDVTHIHRRPLAWWTGHFHQAGWSVEARYRVEGIKDNYQQYPTGNGFIVCRRL
jgi:cyclopropane fatty-acyl-phospholipid synthase-like methyltransferase